MKVCKACGTLLFINDDEDIILESMDGPGQFHAKHVGHSSLGFTYKTCGDVEEHEGV